MRGDFVRGPVDVWAPQISDLLRSVGHIAYVAGGAARELVMRDVAPPAWDIDLFMFDGADVGLCKEMLFGMGYRQDAYTEHSSQFHPPEPETQLAVQVIEHFENEWSLTTGEPEDVLSHFSFTTEMFAVVARSEGFEAVVGVRAPEDTRSRMLKVQNVTDPLIVSLRAVKYGYKGYGISEEEMQKVFDEYVVRSRVPVCP